MKCICPLCGGTGKAEIKSPRKSDEARKLATKMRDKGFTIRRIMVTLGYKSPSTVMFLLKKI